MIIVKNCTTNTIRYADLMGGRKPRLLASVKNHLVSETYLAEDRFAVRD